MDLFFQDPSEVPLPPEEVRIRALHAMPWQDGRRVKIYLEIDPFQKRPNAQVQILDSSGDVIAEVSLIETITRKMEFNMHLRSAVAAGDFQVHAVLYYHQPNQTGETDVGAQMALPEWMIVDQKRTTFVIPA